MNYFKNAILSLSDLKNSEREKIRNFSLNLFCNHFLTIYSDLFKNKND